MIQYIMVFILVFLYAHLYLHFLVNPNNQCSIVTTLTKEEITDHVYQKQPFLLDATLLQKDICLKNKSIDPQNNVDTYIVDYHPVPLLEPYVRFYTHKKVLCCKKKKKWMETNDSCRTFYRVYKGSFRVTCIHPYKKDCIPKTKEHKHLKKNVDLIHLTLHEDSVLFLPKDWNLYIEPLEEGSMLEKLQYYTPLNLLANTISKIPKYIGDSISICSMKEPLFI
jgi:hypothetical protein